MNSYISLYLLPFTFNWMQKLSIVPSDRQNKIGPPMCRPSIFSARAMSTPAISAPEPYIGLHTMPWWRNTRAQSEWVYEAWNYKRGIPICTPVAGTEAERGRDEDGDDWTVDHWPVVIISHWQISPSRTDPAALPGLVGPARRRVVRRLTMIQWADVPSYLAEQPHTEGTSCSV